MLTCIILLMCSFIVGWFCSAIGDYLCYGPLIKTMIDTRKNLDTIDEIMVISGWHPIKRN